MRKTDNLKTKNNGKIEKKRLKKYQHEVWKAKYVENKNILKKRTPPSIRAIFEDILAVERLKKYQHEAWKAKYVENKNIFLKK